MVSVEFSHVRAIDGWELLGDLSREVRDQQNDDEGDEEDDSDYDDGEDFALDVINSREVAVFPNNVSRLRSIFKYHRLAEDSQVVAFVP